MAKTVLVSNRTYGNMEGISKDYIHDSGIALSSERYFDVVNDTFSYNLKLKCRPLYWFVNWWYATTDYKKNKSMSSQKMSRSQLYENVFYWLCVIGFIACVITGVAVPIITSATRSLLLIEGKMSNAAIYANGSFLGYVFSMTDAAGLLHTLTDGDPNTKGTAAYITQELINTYNATHHTKYTFDDVIPSSLGGKRFFIANLNQIKQYILYEFLLGKYDSLGAGYIVSLGMTTNSFQPQDVILSSDPTGQALLIPKIWIAYFAKADVIAPIFFTIFFVVVILVYHYRKKHITPKVNAMSMQAYLTYKLLLVRKFRFLLKRRIPMIKGIKELNHRFVFAADALGTGTVYLNARLLNLLYGTFQEMNVVMVINMADDSAIEQLQKLCDQDFNHNVKIIIADADKVNTLKAKDGYGYLLSENTLHPLSQEIDGLELVDEQAPDYFDKLVVRDKERVLTEHRIRQEQIDMSRRISKYIFRNRRILSDDVKRAEIEKVIAGYEKAHNALTEQETIAMKSIFKQNQLGSYSPRDFEKSN